jgi:hypothetical protein
MASGSESANIVGRALLDAKDAAGTLWRDIEIWLLNVSASGCLLESRHALPSGTAGTLRLQVRGAEYVDEIRVTRCRAIQGGGATFRIGAEFLATAVGNGRSLCSLHPLADGTSPANVPNRRPAVSGTGETAPRAQSLDPHRHP